MAKQGSTRKTKTGNITGSTIGSIGSARDVTVFQREVENSTIAGDAKEALLKAREELETLNLNAKDKRM